MTCNVKEILLRAKNPQKKRAVPNKHMAFAFEPPVDQKATKHIIQNIKLVMNVFGLTLVLEKEIPGCSPLPCHNLGKDLLSKQRDWGKKH